MIVINFISNCIFTDKRKTLKNYITYVKTLKLNMYVCVYEENINVQIIIFPTLFSF